MADFDWNKIQTEYITTNISYKKLADKYGIPMRTLCHHGKNEKWVELRKQHCRNVVTKSVEKAAENAIDYRSSLYALAFKVANQLNSMTDSFTMTDLVGLGIKPRDITGAIKDLEDALHVKSVKEIEEQEARIANLRRQAEADNTDNEIKVVIAGDLEDYAE